MLVRCSECGKQISDLARTCPNCGAPMSGVGGYAVRKSEFKRTVAVLFALIMGPIGWHNAYLGYKKRQYVELFLGIVSLLLFPFGGFILWFILWIWAIVEALSCKVDSDGNILDW